MKAVGRGIAEDRPTCPNAVCFGFRDPVDTGQSRIVNSVRRSSWPWIKPMSERTIRHRLAQGIMQPYGSELVRCRITALARKAHGGSSFERPFLTLTYSKEE